MHDLRLGTARFHPSLFLDKSDKVLQLLHVLIGCIDNCKYKKQRGGEGGGVGVGR
jgi:hypothetical protein